MSWRVAEPLIGNFAKFSIQFVAYKIPVQHLAATAVLPEPINGSSTTSPSLLLISINGKHTFRGFWVLCFVLSLPMHIGA